LTEINASLATATDALSLISGLQAPVESTNESASLIPDFSALLTELMGNVEETETAQPAIPATVAIPELPAILVEEAETKELKEPEETEETEEPKEPEENENNTTPEAGNLMFLTGEIETATFQVQPVKESTEQKQPAASAVPGLRVTPGPLQEAQANAAPKPEMEKAWEDLRKFEFKIEHEAPHRPAHPLQAAAATTDAPQKQPMITTDPMANLKQDRLPPRIVLVQNAGIQMGLPERSKSGADIPAAGFAAAPATTFSDVIRTFDHVEQAAPAQLVEIPDVPQLKVVRTVAMEVGDADSQVVIRIQERSGDVSLQLNAGSEPLRHELQTSVSSLLKALQQEAVKVSNVEVFRKAPIDKVRRMKETR
jgi:hypothetical protein